ncbi:MAG: DNA methyltransferase, partial [Anaerolineae bacterium]
MQTIARLDFTAVKTEGAILPADLLARVAQGNDLPGLSPEDYHLAANERLNEAVNRAWNRCQAAWAGFEEGRARLPDDDAGTTLTRERWLLILFQELGYGRLQTARAASMGGYPISHAWHSVPIHLVSFRQDLDRRGTYTGAVTRSPHGLVQEYLNRTEESLWGFVSNGLRLRILRDNVSLSRLAYVDFDLEAIMSGQLYADFTLLWLLCHQSRVEGERPSECWLERWSREAAQQGARALDSLRDGVREAIEALGRGFLAHPANDALRDRLRAGSLSTQDYYRQLLRLVYRLIFLCVAEDRDLLLLPAEGAGGQDGAGIAEARKRYTEYYSMARLRRLAGSVRGGPHPDLYASLSLVFRMLRTGYPDLALPGLGGFLFSNRATPDLDEASLANADLLEAVRSLAFTVEGRVRRPVDYRNLGSEELGSVYESLLELHPEVTTNQAAPSFVLNAVAGTERKTTGSYYTPPSLVNSLLDSALEPVVEDRLKAARRAGSPDDEAQAALEEALLSIRVVDTACGSGHFLVAAARRLAHHLAAIRAGEEEPGPELVRQAMREVVRRCIFGVDLNEMAVELCKFALWLETMDPGKPLGFLDHNIQCGNSLLGATPELIEAGLPDDAFKPITGDDRAIASDLRKRNKREREGQGALFLGMGPQTSAGNAGAAMAALDAMPEDTTEAVRAREARHNAALADPAYRQAKLLADAWCAAFVWPKWRGAPPAVTTATLRALATRPERVPAATVAEIERLAGQYQFFHWHLAYPEVFEEPLPSPSPFRGGSSPLLAGEGSGERSRGF